MIESREHVTWVTDCRTTECSGMIVRHVSYLAPYVPTTLCASCTSRYFSPLINEDSKGDLLHESGSTRH